MSEVKRHRILLWSLVAFALVLAAPGWYIQMRLAEKVNHLENRVSELEDRLPAAEPELPPPQPPQSSF